MRPGGLVVIGLCERTGLTWLHELLRKQGRSASDAAGAGCSSRSWRRSSAPWSASKTNQLRDDNPRVESQIEDWFFVPIKFFFTHDELRRAFEARGLSFELVAHRTARFRATSISIARGRKR